MISKEIFSHYTVGIDKFDKMHWQLFEIFSELVSVTLPPENVQDKIQELIDFWKTHTDDEVQFMKNIGYPYLTQHLSEHDKITLKLQASKETAGHRPTLNELTFRMRDLARQVQNHIDHSDRQFAEYAKKINVA